jgi:purine nucleosidase
MGPLTDMASALLLDRTIVDRPVGVLWIGGPPHGETLPSYGPESNLIHDVAAANVVFGSGIPIWQIPMDIYQQTSVSHLELLNRVQPHGELGNYLYSQLVEYAQNDFPFPMESHSLGDNPAVIAMINPMSLQWRWHEPVRFTPDGQCVPSSRGSRVKVAVSVDTRFMFEDFFAKLSRGCPD